jgi:hypothetical protein
MSGAEPCTGSNIDGNSSAEAFQFAVIIFPVLILLIAFPSLGLVLV